jgi:hypothetical protein
VVANVHRRMIAIFAKEECLNDKRIAMALAGFCVFGVVRPECLTMACADYLYKHEVFESWREKHRSLLYEYRYPRRIVPC